MQQEQNKSTRKKFLFWGLGIVSSVTALRFFGLQSKKNETVKMLTQDGKLVEIDKKLVPGSSKKITTEQLQGWVKK